MAFLVGIFLCFFDVIRADYVEAKAMLDPVYGTSGYISIIEGNIIVNIDLTKFAIPNETYNIASECYDNGLLWSLTDDNNIQNGQGFGENQCGINNVGKRLDYWRACSRMSNEPECSLCTGQNCNNDPCIQSSSINGISNSNPYICNPTEFNENRNIYSCEVGDLSGKYGVINDRIVNTVYSSPWNPNGADMAGKSIVFYCNTPIPVPMMCKTFTTTNMPGTPPYTRPQLGNSASMNFNGLMVNNIDYSGVTVTVTEGSITYSMPEAVYKDCTTWTAYIHDTWTHSSSMPMYDTNCDSQFTGEVWDPEHSCISNSGSIWCNNNQRCPDNNNPRNINYNCDNTNNIWDCAAGDLSGRTGGSITPSISLFGTYTMTYNNIGIPPVIHYFEGKSLVLKCNDNTGNVDSICTPIFASNINLAAISNDNNMDDGKKWTAGGTLGLICLILLVIGLPIVYYIAKNKKNNDDKEQGITSENNIILNDNNNISDGNNVTTN